MSDDDQLAYRLRKPLSAHLMSYAALLDLGRGTAFPTTGHDGAAVQAGARFWRTDLGWLCYYDGTRWLTTHEYSSNFTAYARNAMPYSGGAAALQVAPVTSSYAIYLTGAICYLDVATTNNGTNFWSLALKDGATTIWSFNTSAIAANTYSRFSFSTGTVFASPSFMSLEVTGKTGAPGSLALNTSAYYRLIIT